MASILELLSGGGAKDEESSSPVASGGPEREYAREAFSALKDDDEEGFVSAFISAVKACSKKAETDEYEPDEDALEE